MATHERGWQPKWVFSRKSTGQSNAIPILNKLLYSKFSWKRKKNENFDEGKKKKNTLIFDVLKLKETLSVW